MHRLDRGIKSILNQQPLPLQIYFRRSPSSSLDTGIWLSTIEYKCICILSVYWMYICNSYAYIFSSINSWWAEKLLWHSTATRYLSTIQLLAGQSSISETLRHSQGCQGWYWKKKIYIYIFIHLHIKYLHTSRLRATRVAEVSKFKKCTAIGSKKPVLPIRTATDLHYPELLSSCLGFWHHSCTVLWSPSSHLNSFQLVLAHFTSVAPVQLFVSAQSKWLSCKLLCSPQLNYLSMGSWFQQSFVLSSSCHVQPLSLLECYLWVQRSSTRGPPHFFLVREKLWRHEQQTFLKRTFEQRNNGIILQYDH